MFSWSRGEIWLAVLVSVLIVIGGVGHLWLSYARLQGATVIVEAAGAAMDRNAQSGDDVIEASDGDKSSDNGIGSGVASDAAVAAGGEDVGEAVSDRDISTNVGTERPVTSPAVGGGADTRININTASAAELQRLPGIGPTLAARIVAYREAWGPFSKIEDIMEVSGIGPRRFEDIKHLIRVD